MISTENSGGELQRNTGTGDFKCYFMTCRDMKTMNNHSHSPIKFSAVFNIGFCLMELETVPSTCENPPMVINWLQYLLDPEK